MPWLFQGYLIHYWMLIVMAVAFAGAGLGEWFQRRRLAVLCAALGADGAAAAAVAGGRLLDRADGQDRQARGTSSAVRRRCGS